MSLMFTGYQACCGAGIIWGFHHSVPGNVATDAHVDNLVFYLRTTCKIEKVTGYIHTCILIEDQLWAQPTLEDYGFRLASDKTVNSNSNHRLYFFIRDPETPKPKPVKKSAFKKAA